MSNIIEIMISYKADGFIEELLQSLLFRYQTGLERLMKGSNFIFDYIHLLYNKCQKINFNRGRSYIDFPDWIKKGSKNSIHKKIMNAFNTL